MSSNRFCSAAVVLGLLALSAAGIARADTLLTYDLSGVSFSDGAKASGDFVLDATTDKVTAWDISVTTGSFAGITIPAQTFNSALAHTSVGYAGPRGQDFLFYSDLSGKNFLNLYFAGSLLSAPAQVALNKFGTGEFLLVHGGAFATGLAGSGGEAVLVNAVPEPSSAALMLAGALVVGATLRRRSTVRI
jgi:hypothetical protein